MNMSFVLATGMLAGTIIGAGIFSLPFVASVTGIGLSLLYLLFFGIIYSMLYSMYASLFVNEVGTHDLFFLAKKYLPSFMMPVVIINTLFGIIFALLAYLVLVPSFTLFAFGIGGVSVVLVFWIISSIFFFVRSQSLGLAEFVGTSSIISCVLFIFFLAIRSGFKISDPLYVSNSLGALLLPFGPILFSFSGRSAIAHVVRIWRVSKQKHETFKINSAIRLGVLVPVVVYILFVISVISLNPNYISEDSLSGLFSLPIYAKITLSIVGLLTLWTSYIMLGTNVKEILRFDLRTPTWLAVGVPLVVPLALFLFGFDNFIQAISISGGIFVAIEGILMLWMWFRAFPHRPKRWLGIVPAFAFLLSLVYTCLQFFPF